VVSISPPCNVTFPAYRLVFPDPVTDPAEISTPPPEEPLVSPTANNRFPAFISVLAPEERTMSPLPLAVDAPVPKTIFPLSTPLLVLTKTVPLPLVVP